VIFLAGFLTGGLSPKNLALMIILASVMTEANLSFIQEFIICLTLALVGSVGVVAPIAVTLYWGEQADQKLKEWQAWLISRAGMITVAVLLILGAWLTLQGLTAFR
jgi:hypothetical protein